MVGEMPGDAALDAFGKDIGATVRLTTPLTLEKRSPHVGFEIEPRPNVSSFTPSAPCAPAWATCGCACAVSRTATPT
jgi:hypothetical protein